MAAGSAAVLSNFIINLCICVGVFVAFSFLRVSAFARKFYAPRRYANDLDLKPTRLPNVIAAWVLPLLTYPEEAIIDETGLDSAIYLRVQWFGLQLFFVLSLVTVVTVLPVNLTGKEVDNLLAKNNNVTGQKYKFTDFDHYSLSNVEQGSNKMWVHLLAVYFVTLYTLWLLWKYSKEAVLLRLMFLANAQRGGPSHTVLVTDIPAIRGAHSGKPVTYDTPTPELNAKTSGLKAHVTREGNGKGSGDATLDGEDEVLCMTPLTNGPGSHTELGKTGVTLVQHAVATQTHGAVPVGLSHHELESELMEERALRWGPPSRRITKRFNYDLSDMQLDPAVQARRLIKDGMPADEVVRKEFELVYTKEVVAAVNMVYDQSNLGPLVAEYDQVKQDLEDFLSMAELRLRLRRKLERPKVTIIRPKAYGEWGVARYGTKWFQKVDAMDHWIARLHELRRLIMEEQEVARAHVAPAAFVTFSTRTAQCTAAAALHHHDEMAWRVQPAPAPQEILWGSLLVPTPVKNSSALLMWAAFWAMTFFFMIPCGVLQALIDIPKLATYPGLKEFVTAPVVKQLLEAIVPGLVLKIFIAMVPVILALFMRISGASSDSEVDFGVARRYFCFQVVVVFFGSVISGSLFNQLNAWLKNPGSVISILGTSIPSVSTFFITYTLITGLGAQSIVFMRIPNLVLFWIFTKLAGSPAKKERLWSQQYATSAVSVVQQCVSMLLGLVYSCINPIICLACLAYFLVANITERYNYIYVFRRTYESGGKLWGVVFSQVMVALYIMQLTMLGLLSIKTFAFSPVLIPLVLGTFIYHVYVLRLMARPWNVMSLHDAAELDNFEAAERRAMLEADRAEKGSGMRALAKLRLRAAHARERQRKEGGYAAVPSVERGVVEGLTPEEKREVAEMYRSPVFKVAVHEVDKLTAAVESVGRRILEEEARRARIQALQGGDKAAAEEAEAAERTRLAAEVAQEEFPPEEAESVDLTLASPKRTKP